MNRNRLNALGGAAVGALAFSLPHRLSPASLGIRSPLKLLTATAVLGFAFASGSGGRKKRPADQNTHLLRWRCTEAVFGNTQDAQRAPHLRHWYNSHTAIPGCERSCGHSDLYTVTFAGESAATEGVCERAGTVSITAEPIT